MASCDTPWLTVLPKPAGIGPWRLIPELRRRPWGGVWLAARFPDAAHPREPVGEPFGEAWLAGPEARIAEGPQVGWSLQRLAAHYGPQLLGAAPTQCYGERFPLLIKLLDAAQPLSIQVHPDDAYAAAHASAGGDLGKTEAWWVLETSPDACVWWGFAAALSRDALRAAASQGALAPLLRRIPVAPHDVIINPAGTVHALGAGVLAYEVQQASDLTYRLDDHGRRDAAGNPRPLHLDDGVAVALLEPGGQTAPPATLLAPGRWALAHTHAFVLERLEPPLDGTLSIELSTLSFELISHLGDQLGSGQLDARAINLTLAPGSSWLFAAGSGTIRLAGGGPYARVRFPSASDCA